MNAGRGTPKRARSAAPCPSRSASSGRKARGSMPSSPRNWRRVCGCSGSIIVTITLSAHSSDRRFCRRCAVQRASEQASVSIRAIAAMRYRSGDSGPVCGCAGVSESLSRLHDVVHLHRRRKRRRDEREIARVPRDGEAVRKEQLLQPKHSEETIQYETKPIVKPVGKRK